MLIMIAFLATAGIFDHLLHRIPNQLTGIMLVACVFYNLAVKGHASVLPVVLRIVVTGLVLFPFFMIGALGAGDVKLFAVCSGFMEAQRILYFVFLSLILAGILGVIKMAARKEISKRFLILKMYILNCIRTGKPERYHCNKAAEEESGVPIAGAMLISALIGIGGFY